MRSDSTLARWLHQVRQSLGSSATLARGKARRERAVRQLRAHNQAAEPWLAEERQLLSAPAVVLSVTDATYTENAPPVTLDPAITANDPDADFIQGAQVQITDYELGQDQLSFTANHGISGSFDNTTGILTLNGNATASQYASVLSSVQYQNLSENPTDLQRTIEYTITDTEPSTSAPVTLTLNLVPVADTPADVNATVDEDTLSGPIVLAPNPADGTSVTHYQITDVTGGTLYLNDGMTVVNNGDFISQSQATSGLKFQGNTDYFGAASFKFQAATGNTPADLGGAKATANITIDPVADTPADVAAMVDEDTLSGPIVLAPNAVDNGSVTHYQITGITGGTLYQADGVTQIQNGDFITAADAAAGVKFQGNANYFGAASFKFQAATGGTVGDLGGGLATANITVKSVNDDPTITGPGAQTVNEGTVLTFSNATLNPITINDVDAASNIFTVEIQATGPTATHTLGSTSGISFVQGTNGGTTPLIIQGTLSDLQAALNGLQVQPQDNGTLDLTLIVTDEALASDQVLVPITVNNVAPMLTLNPVMTVNENGVATLSGTITDPGTADTFMLMVDWGDGTPPVTYVYPAGTTTFSETHQYLDDNPTGTSSDTYTISATLTDDDTGIDTKTTTVTVNNVAPVLVLNPMTAVSENGIATLSGTITDPGTADTFTLVVDWGAGSAPVTYTYAAGTTTFSETHQYLDDNPSGTSSDTYTISATLTDDDTGAETKTTSVTVNNVAPVLVLNPVAAVSENGVATLSGTITDPGTADTFTLVVDWGDGSAPVTYTYAAGTTSFSETHQYLDDNPTGTSSDTYTISATLTDDDTGSDTKTTSITVNNVVPVLVLNPVAAVSENGVATLSGTITDPGTADTFTLVVDWGDGTPPVTYTYAAGTTMFSETHQYLDDNPSGTSSDSYTISATLTDDDTGVTTKTTTVTVNNVNPTLTLVGPPPNTINEGEFITVTGSATDPANQPLLMPTTINDPLTYTWSVTKDGNAYDSGLGNVANFQAVDNGVYVVTMTVTDDDLGSDTQTYTINVANVAPTPTVTGDTTGFEGTAINLTASSTDPANMPTTPTDNDSVMYTWSVTRNGNFYSSGAGTSYTLTPNNEGTYVVTLTAADEDGGVQSTTHTVVVANVAPTATINATDIDGQFYTYVDVAVDDPGNDNISVLIVWGDINPDDYLNDPFLNGETATTRDFPTVSHRYLTAPNPQDPLAPVTITFFINDGTTTVVQTVVVQVTEQGIPAGGVYVTPEPEQIVLPVVQAVVEPPAILTQPAQQQVRNEEVVSREDTLTDEDARLVLHVVGPTGAEGPAVTLPDGLLKNLRGLFNKLPDGHYRVYLVQGESRRLVIEVFVRQGRAIDPAEADQGTQERPPQAQPAAQNELNRVMQADRVANLLCKLEAVPEETDPLQPSPDVDASPNERLLAGQVGYIPAAPDSPEEPKTAENAEDSGVASLAAAGFVAGESWRRAARRQRAAAVTTGPDNGEKIEKTWSRLARRARQWKPR